MKETIPTIQLNKQMTTQERLELDTNNRDKAINPLHSFIIEAPAGAGKTELLTQRFLALLARVKDPEEIIALTFTNKAAAEMRARVLSSLEMAASGVRPEAPHKQITFDLGMKVLDVNTEYQWGLLKNAGRLQITTLDALCGKLARQMPFLSRFGSQPSVSTDNARQYRRAARNTLDLLEEGGVVSEPIERVLAYFNNDANRLQTLLESMLSGRDQWLRHAHNQTGSESQVRAEAALAALLNEEMGAVAAALPASLQNQLMPVARFVADQAFNADAKHRESQKSYLALGNWTAPLNGSIDELPLWLGLADLLLTKEHQLRAQPPNSLGFNSTEGKPHKETLKRLLEDLKERDQAAALARVRKLPAAHFEAGEWQIIEDLIAMLKLAAAQLWLVFKEERQVDFIQVAQNASQALGEEENPTDLQQQLDYRISHLLVDEFQDTSPTQIELLEKLTAGWQNGDGRTLFVVGDPMQSVYRFRKADVGLFLKVRDQGLGQIMLTPLQLYRNNRSYKEVVDWVNATFPTVFVDGDNKRHGSVKFSPAEATKGSTAAATIQFHPIIDQNGKDFEAEGEEDEEDASLSPADEREAEQVIALIRQAQKEEPAGSIAILVKARSHLKAIIKALRRIGDDILYQAVEIEGLSQRQSIQDLAALTCALHHRADRVNWLAVLRAPWCGLTLADLHQLAADDHASTIWQLMQDEQRLQTLSEDGRQRLGYVRAVMAEAFANEGRQRPRRWVEGVWQSLGGPLCLAQSSDLLDVAAFFGVLDAMENRGQLDIAELEAELDKLYAAPDPSAKYVQIMTIHKSKGLEFDTVILPALHKQARAEDKPLLIWDELILEDGREELVVAAIQKNKSKDEPNKYDFLREFEKSRTSNENQRLLYVAVTRAIRQLHLLGIGKLDQKDKDGLVKAPIKSAFLHLLWPNCKAEFEAAALAMRSPDNADQNPRIAIDGTTFIPQLIRLARPKLHPALNDQWIDKDGKHDEPTDIDENIGSVPANLATDTGTLVHRYLEMIARDGLDAWPVSRIENAQARFVQWFAGNGYGTDDCTRAANDVRANLLKATSSATGRWILGPHESAECEVGFTTTENGISQSHIVDRTFVENGIRWVIDYKTTRYEGDDLDGFLNARAENYRGQMARYASLYKAEAGALKVAIYFVSEDRNYEFDFSDGAGKF